MALLYNQDTLDDDSTVGSHGLTEGTTVTLSMAQDPERGRAVRQQREARERLAPLRKARRCHFGQRSLPDIALSFDVPRLVPPTLPLGHTAAYAMFP